MAENAPSSFVKDGVYYFVRRVPKDLLHRFASPKISFSLRTRSASVATSRALRAAQRLDEHWFFLSINDGDLPGKHMLRGAQNSDTAASVAACAGTATSAVKLSDAIAIYLRLKGQKRPVTFHRAVERSFGCVIDVCGDKDITAFTKADTNGFRDNLIKRGLTESSIIRIFGTVRSVINFAASEVGIDISNPFGRVTVVATPELKTGHRCHSKPFGRCSLSAAVWTMICVGWSR